MYLIVEFAHKLLSDYVLPGEICVDATCGNGNDTLLLANLVGPLGKVYTFDIQEQALTRAKELCHLFTNIEYIFDSHEHINEYISDKIKAVIYNLGYLPNGNKEITTLTTSTLKSIKSLLARVTSESLLIIIVVYPGHAEGKKESEALASLIKDLDKGKFFVTKYENCNRDSSPYLLTISPNKRK